MNHPFAGTPLIETPKFLSMGFQDVFICDAESGFEALKKLHRRFGRQQILSTVDMDVSINGGTPKSSILEGVSLINHQFLGTLNEWKPPDDIECRAKIDFTFC